MPSRLCACVVLVWLLLGCGKTDRAQPRGEAAVSPVDGYAAQPARIFVDGEFADWESRSVRHVDTSDAAGDALGIDRFWMAHDDRYLFVRVELNRAISLQEQNALTLHLDTDDDSTTGAQAAGVGAEVHWTFGERRGTVEGARIEHAALGLHVLPTVRADAFELALDRTARPAGQPLFPTDSLRVALSSDGDRLPDTEGGLGYVMTDPEWAREAPTPARSPDADVRVLSQNAKNNFEANRNAIFEAPRQPHYRRILDALGPDVVALQEVYDQTAAEVEQVAEETLGRADDWTWRKEGLDLVLGSRFPIVETHAISGFRRIKSGAFLLDTRSALGTPLVVVVMHPPCCNRPGEGTKPPRDEQRQRVVDGVAAFLRDVTSGTGPFDVPPQTPIAVVGDMNFVGDPQQPRTLRTGEIVHTDEVGEGKPPDWDGSALLDVNPQQTGAPLHTTWIDSTSAFAPGRLDYAYVTDSVVDVAHAFVLSTRSLPDTQRTAHGLRRNDTAAASDHLPVVIDLSAPVAP